MLYFIIHKKKLSSFTEQIFIACVLWIRLNPLGINKSKKECLHPYDDLKVYSWGEDNERDG